MKIILTGGTGFIGKSLVKRLQEEKHNVVLLTRNSNIANDLRSSYLKIERWDGRTTGSWSHHVEGADAVINLAGEPIADKRWSVAQKERILNSRLDATKAIVSAMEQAKKKPSILVNSSGVDYYGNVETGYVTESHPKGTGFVADVCARWEREAVAAEKLEVRVVFLRTGLVLEKDGGALKKMLLPFKMFVGGPLGSGGQWFPWIHRDDVIGIILFALENSKLSGPINVAAPEPVTMKQFCKALGKAMRRPSWAPVPAFVLRILFGEMAEILLGGRRVVPQKLVDAGYKFRYQKLDEALTAILRR